MKSKFFTLNLKDLIKGFIVAFSGALLTTIYQAINAGTIQWTIEFWQPILLTSVGAGISYLLKNLFTNSNDEFAKKDNSDKTDIINNSNT